MRTWVLFGLLVLTSTASARDVAPDANVAGPLEVTSGEYRFAAELDTEIHPDAMTEVWARVHRPENLGTERLPLVIMLHGNHATCGEGPFPRSDTSCQYTQSGTCPEGFVVAPNHAGYDYIGKKLASWGYVVVSINANRGITCGGGLDGDWGLNLARGRLVLKHLALWSRWSRSGGAPSSISPRADEFLGRIDWDRVGLFGHSRGGEGMRAAYNLWRDSGSIWQERIPGLNIRAIFEVGAVDGQTDRVLDADEPAWNQLLPLCDGDVSDLQGMAPYFRMLARQQTSRAGAKSLYHVWGTNHNFYNTEWQQSDAVSCHGHEPVFPLSGESLEQQQVGAASTLAFFRGHLGTNEDRAFRCNFDPTCDVPESARVVRVDRDYSMANDAERTVRFEEFDQESGVNTAGVPNEARGVTVEHRSHRDMGFQFRAATITWSSKEAPRYYQLNWTAEGQGRDASGYDHLEFRARRTYAGNEGAETAFSLALVDATGRVSAPIDVSEQGTLAGPGHPTAFVFQSYRIALAEIAGIDLTNLRGVRLIFDQTASGKIMVANVRFSRAAAKSFAHGPFASSQNAGRAGPRVIERDDTVARLGSLSAEGETVAIEVFASRPIPVLDALATLHVGREQLRLSHFPDMTAMDRIVFTLSHQAFLALPDHAEVSLELAPGRPSWGLGELDKSKLKK